MRCSGCNAAYYCSDMCRKCDWRYHRPCSKEAPSTRVNPPRLRVFGRFAHAAPADFRALEAVHHVPSHYAELARRAVPRRPAPVPFHHRQARGGRRRARRALARPPRPPAQIALYTPALDSLFTLPVYVRLWNILTLNSTAVSPQSLFLSYFFDVVRIAREDMPSVRRSSSSSAQSPRSSRRIARASRASAAPASSRSSRSSITRAPPTSHSPIIRSMPPSTSSRSRQSSRTLSSLPTTSRPMQAADTRTRRRILATQYLFKCDCSMCRLDDDATKTNATA
jgi:hypothetical protein